jgi:phage-related protein
MSTKLTRVNGYLEDLNGLMVDAEIVESSDPIQARKKLGYFRQEIVDINKDIEAVTSRILSFSKGLDSFMRSLGDGVLSNKNVNDIGKSHRKAVQIVRDLMDVKNGLISIVAPIINSIKSIKK